MNESHPGGAFQPQLFGLLFEAHPHAMLVVDPGTTRILLANPSAARLFGRPAGSLNGTFVAELRATGVVPAPRGRAPRPEDFCRGGIWRVPRKEGDVLLEIVSTEIEVNGKPALLVVGADVTQRENETRSTRQREQL